MPKKRVKSAKKEAKKKKASKAAPKKEKAAKDPKVVVRKVMYVVESVPEQYIFHLNDGRILRSLNDLISALDTMSDELFQFHANDQRNDFSSWIRDIINENDLSANICGKSRIDTKNEIIRFLKKKGSLKG